MNEETFNASIRQFLKNVGITSQREIEKSVWSQLDKKQLKGNETLPATMRLEIPALGLSLTIAGDITLE
jgi:Family of unknown function (DUF6494)